MNYSLAQCPFCFGAKPNLANHLISFQVICQTCHATGPKKQSKKDAIISWNQLSEDLARSRQWHAKQFIGKLKEIEVAIISQQELLKTAD